VMTPK